MVIFAVEIIKERRREDLLRPPVTILHEQISWCPIDTAGC